MRVIAGTARGRRLEAPAGSTVRPTTDRVKEALFSILMPYLRGATVLDLYAGSGALGIEALSRGAATATFIESDRRALDVIRRNLDSTRLAARADVRRGTLPAALSVVAGPVDIVVTDPPYALDDGALAETLARVAMLLAPGGIVAVERDRRSGGPPWPADLGQQDPRRYGDTTLHLATRPET